MGARQRESEVSSGLALVLCVCLLYHLRIRRVIPAKHQMMYTWLDPAGPRVIFWNDRDRNSETDLRRDGLNEYRSIDDEEANGSGAGGDVDRTNRTTMPAYWVAFLDGTQRVLLFTDSFSIAKGANSANRLDQVAQEIEVEIHGIGVSLVNNITMVDIMYIGMASSNVIWEERKRGKYYKALNIETVQRLEAAYQHFLLQQRVGAVEGNAFSLGDDGIVEITDEAVVWRQRGAVRPIRRTFYPGLWVNIKSSPYQLQLHAKINRIQIDNQLMDVIFPVVLAPVPPPKSVAATTGEIHVRYFLKYSEWKRKNDIKKRRK